MEKGIIMKYVSKFVAGLFVLAVVSVTSLSIHAGVQEAKASEQVEIIAFDTIVEDAVEESSHEEVLTEETSMEERSVEETTIEETTVDEITDDSVTAASSLKNVTQADEPTEVYGCGIVGFESEEQRAAYVDALPDEYEVIASATVEREWTEEEIAQNYTMEQKSVMLSNGKNMGYWLYKPYETDKKMPLVIYLHGKDGCGSNLNRLMKIEGIPQYINEGKIYPNAIVISPQCPSGSSWTKQADAVMELIDAVVAEENIDRSRISLTGASLGGIGTFNIAIKNPTYFSAIVPVCGSVTASKCSVLNDVAVKIYHGTRDTGMGFSVKDAAVVIAENGGNCELNMLEGKGHEIRYVYHDDTYNVLEWMINQQRTDVAP